MKKWAVGCLITLAILLIVAVSFLTASYMFLVRPYLMPMMAERGITTQNSRLTNQSPYTPPSDGRLSGDQVTRFVSVQSDVSISLRSLRSLRTQAGVIERVYGALREGKGGERRSVPLASALNGLRQASTALWVGKAAQVDALNKAGLSSDEFEWVLVQVYQAGDVDLWSIDLEGVDQGLGALIRRRGMWGITADAAFSGIQGAGLEVTLIHKVRGGVVPEGNAALVAPYLTQLREWLPIAFFGL
jgi:hypothetical protein